VSLKKILAEIFFDLKFKSFFISFSDMLDRYPYIEPPAFASGGVSFHQTYFQKNKV
jgi:hypothetical protein